MSFLLNGVLATIISIAAENYAEYQRLLVIRYDLYLTRCPCCGHDHLIRWGYYQRQGLPRIHDIKIQRVRCTGCGRTTNVLPSFLLAYKCFSFRVLQQLLLFIMKHPDDWKQILTTMLDASTVFRWLRRFIKQANTSLPAIRKALLELEPDTQLLPPPSLAVKSISAPPNICFSQNRLNNCSASSTN